MSKYVYLLLVSIALGFTMFTIVSPGPSATPQLSSPHTLVLDSLPVEGAPLTGVVKQSKSWFQLPDIPVSPKQKDAPFLLEKEENPSELNLPELNLSVLNAMLAMFLSLYQ